MLSQALALALAGSIYPPAIAVVIAFGRGEDVRRRVAAFVGTAWLTVFVVGLLLLTVLSDVGVGSHKHKSLGPGVDLACGIALLVIAVWLRRPRPRPQTAKTDTPSRTERYLQSARLAAALGVILYVVPSPIYIGAVAAVAATNDSTSAQVGYLVVLILIMLWLVELPMLALLVNPVAATARLERVNLWFGRHGRDLAVLACVGAGLYLAIKGFVDLVS